jgi:hypothetical protein
MATGAGLAEWEQTHGKKKAKCVLTSTGLLMEGLCSIYDDTPTKGRGKVYLRFENLPGSWRADTWSISLCVLAMRAKKWRGLSRVQHKQI